MYPIMKYNEQQQQQNQKRDPTKKNNPISWWWVKKKHERRKNYTNHAGFINYDSSNKPFIETLNEWP